MLKRYIKKKATKTHQANKERNKLKGRKDSPKDSQQFRRHPPTHWTLRYTITKNKAKQNKRKQREVQQFRRHPPTHWTLRYTITKNKAKQNKTKSKEGQQFRRHPPTHWTLRYTITKHKAKQNKVKGRPAIQEAPTNTLDLVSRQRGRGHGQVGLATGAGEGCGDEHLLSIGRSDAGDL